MITRSAWCAALLAVSCLVLTASAQTVTSTSDTLERPAAPSPFVRGAHQPSAAAVFLAKTIDSVSWDDITFEEVIEWLHEHSEGKVNIVPRWNRLEIEGVAQEDFVTLQLKGATIAVILDETLDQLSEDGKLRFRGIGKSIQISTEADFGRRLYLRVYNVTDILFRVPDFQEGAPQIDLQGLGSSGGGGGGSGGGGGGGQGGRGSVFSQGGGQSNQGQFTQQEGEGELEKTLEDLRELIISMIEPDSWFDNNGDGEILAYNRSLVVLNTMEVHEMIAGAFALGE